MVLDIGGQCDCTAAVRLLLPAGVCQRYIQFMQNLAFGVKFVANGEERHYYANCIMFEALSAELLRLADSRFSDGEGLLPH